MPPHRPDPAHGALMALANLCASLAMLSRAPGPNRRDSLALRLHDRAWARLLAGQGANTAMLATLAEALASLRLGELDTAGLAGLGVAPAAAAAAPLRALNAALAAVHPRLRPSLRAHAEAPLPPPLPLPACLRRQAERPPGARQGASLAERSLRLALLGAVLAAEEGADPAQLFLAGMAHALPEDRPGLPGAVAKALTAAGALVTVPGTPAAVAFGLALAGGPALRPRPEAAARRSA